MDFIDLPDDKDKLKTELRVFFQQNSEAAVDLFLNLKDDLDEAYSKIDCLEKKVEDSNFELMSMENSYKKKIETLRKINDEFMEEDEKLKNESEDLKQQNQCKAIDSEKLKALKDEIRELKKYRTQAKKDKISLESKLDTAIKKNSRHEETIKKMHKAVEKTKSLKLEVKSLKEEKKDLNKQIKIVNYNSKQEVYKKTNGNYFKDKDVENDRDEAFLKFKNNYKLDKF